MNRIVFSIGSLILLAFSFSFKQKNSFSKNDIIGCWTSSIEEANPNSNESVFRPCDFKIFPPRRYRYRIELNDNDNCSWLVLAPNDGHYMTDGTWSYNKETQTICIFDLSMKVINKFKIIELKKDIMKTQNLEN